jgi:hypothetical protein
VSVVADCGQRRSANLYFVGQKITKCVFAESIFTAFGCVTLDKVSHEDM